MLNITKKTEDEKFIVSLEGRLDTVTAPELEKELNESVDEASDLVMDFEKLEYISSAVLRVLLASHKRLSKAGSFKIINVNETIMEIFEVTGFSDILTIE